MDAGRDVNIVSAENTASGSYFQETKQSGFSADVMSGVSYGKSVQNSNQTYSAVTQSGSSVTGGDVTLQAGRDAVVRSSVVIADTDLTAIAGRDVRVEAARDTTVSHNEAYAKSTTVGITPGASGRYTAFGQSRSTQDGVSSSETAVQSVLSANAGSLTLIGGVDNQHQGTGSGNVSTQGGTLLAQEGVALSGNSVTLGTANSRSDDEFNAQSKSFTIGSQLSGLVGSLIVQAGDAVQAARHSDNDRVQAAAALKAGYDAYKLASTTAKDLTAAAGTAAQPGDPGAAGIGISVSVGSSKSRQSEQQSSTQQAGTTIQASQIDIQAREGDLKATGAKLQAQDISLQAAGNIDLQAAKNTAELHSTNSGSSAGAGVTVGFGEQNGISFQVSASRSRGNADGNELTHDNTVVTASDKLTVRSGADTTLRGAELAGSTVIADIGGDLHIQTLQDESHYKSDQKSSGFSASVCVPPICYGNMVTGSYSMSKEQIDHDFQSAQAQSGIAAGAGGFDIAVAGHTDLKGAAITSSAEQDKNRLSTGSLSYSDLTNTQTTYAESESVSAGYGGGGVVATIAANVVGNVLANEMGDKGLPESITQTSTTHSVISPANVTITGSGSSATDAQSTENVAALTSRDASTANASLTNQLTLQQAQALKAEQEEARENQIAANYVGAVITNVIGDVAQAQGWEDGGWQKTALHGMAGLIQAKVAGTDAGKAMVAAMLNEQMLPLLENYLISQGITLTNDETKADYVMLMQAASTLLGSAFDAASVTYTATVNNYLKHAERVQLKKAEKACYTTGDAAACSTKAALEYKDKTSDRLLANAVASCEGAECNEVASYIKQQMVGLGCPEASACPDYGSLSEYWKVAQAKAQGLEGVYPESWLLDAKAVLDLGKLGIKLASGAMSATRSSLDALGQLAKADAKDLANVYDMHLGAKPLGTPIGSYDLITGQGPLRSDLASTFSGGRYTEVVLQQDTVLYRGGTADRPYGQFFSQEDPIGVLQTRIDKAVLPYWPGGGESPITSSIAIKIPAGTKVYVGGVSWQGGFYVGGISQIVVPTPWNIPGVKILEIKPIK